MPKDCACQLDPDGQCAKCRERALLAVDKFKVLMTQFVVAMDKIKVEFMEKIKELGADLSGASEDLDLVGPCDGCAEKYADLLLSRLVYVLRDIDSKAAIGIMQGAIFKVCELGVQKLPLTEKAWIETGGGPLKFP